MPIVNHFRCKVGCTRVNKTFACDFFAQKICTPLRVVRRSIILFLVEKEQNFLRGALDFEF